MTPQPNTTCHFGRIIGKGASRGLEFNAMLFNEAPDRSFGVNHSSAFPDVVDNAIKQSQEALFLLGLSTCQNFKSRNTNLEQNHFCVATFLPSALPESTSRLPEP
jgi:hypothetical protein